MKGKVIFMHGVQKIDELVTSVTAQHGVIDSAILLLNSFQTRLQAGIDAALEGGATAEHLEVLVALKADVDAKKDALAAAVAANP